MRAQYLALSLLWSACGFQISAGTATDDDGGVPDARPVTDGGGVVDMPIDMAPQPVDSDGDGHPDSSDNCPQVANPDQRNHDGDAFGDACDRCPHLASSSDPDSDGDGVGDACDPRPNNNADRRKLWAGFYDQAEIMGWLGVGMWTVNGGQLLQGSSSQSGITAGGITNRAFVMTRLSVVEATTANYEIGVSVVHGANSRSECTVLKNGSNVSARARVLNSSDETSGWNASLGVGSAPIDITLDFTDDVDCEFVQGMNEDDRDVSFGNNNAVAGGVYLGSQGVKPAFDYLFIVDMAP